MRAKVSDYQLRSRAVHLWSKEIMQELKVQKCHSVCTHVDWGGGGGRKKRGKLTVCLKDESHRREREMRRRVDGGRRCGSEAIMDTLWFWCAVGDETEEKGEEEWCWGSVQHEYFSGGEKLSEKRGLIQEESLPLQCCANTTVDCTAQIIKLSCREGQSSACSGFLEVAPECVTLGLAWDRCD